MISLGMNEDEVKLLKDILERYHSHLKIEISHTRLRAFKEALKEREKSVGVLTEKVKGLIK